MQNDEWMHEAGCDVLMHFIYLLTPTAGQTHLVYAFHGCHSLVMQACKYAALRQAWTVTLDHVIQRLLDHVRDSLSLQISGEYQSFKSALEKGSKTSLDQSSLSSAAVVSVAKLGPQAELNELRLLLFENATVQDICSCLVDSDFRLCVHKAINAHTLVSF